MVLVLYSAVNLKVRPSNRVFQLLNTSLIQLFRSLWVGCPFSCST